MQRMCIDTQVMAIKKGGNILINDIKYIQYKHGYNNISQYVFLFK